MPHDQQKKHSPTSYKPLICPLSGDAKAKPHWGFVLIKLARKFVFKIGSSDIQIFCFTIYS